MCIRDSTKAAGQALNDQRHGHAHNRYQYRNQGELFRFPMLEEQGERADPDHADSDARHEHVAEQQGCNGLVFRAYAQPGQQAFGG